MLVDFDLVLIALDLIHHLFGCNGCLHDSVYVPFVVTHHSIVVLTKLLQILLIHLNLSFHVFFTLSLF